MLLWTLGAPILGNIFTGKGVMRAERGFNKMEQMDKNV